MRDDSKGILRRDFLNGALVAAGGTALLSLSPMQMFAGGGAKWHGTQGVDARFGRGGNLRSAYNVAHWMRDGRLDFSSPAQVRIAPGPLDQVEGTFPVHEDPTPYDVVIVGAGLSGLSAAFYLRQRRPGTRILFLDANEQPGGNAGRDLGPPLPGVAATGGAYALEPYADFLTELYRGIGLRWEDHVVQAPFYSYFVDEKTPHALPNARGWTLNAYGDGAGRLPYPQEVLADLLRAKAQLAAWYDVEGAPTDPADHSDPRYDGLAQQSFADYLTRELGCHPAVSDFYTRFTVDALGGTAHQVNAYSAISFLSAEYRPMFALPGGTAALALMLVRSLNPESFRRGTRDVIAAPLRMPGLDTARSEVRLRQQAVAVRADVTQGGAQVTYFQDGRFARARARAVVLAGQGHTGQRLVGHLLSDEAAGAWRQVSRVPVVVANVVLKSARPLVELGLGFNQYYWGSKYWADFVIADWVGPSRQDPDRPVALTFYGGNEAPPEELAAERLKLLSTPFGDYELSLKDDLTRVLAGTGFDFDRDVSGVLLYRWGHGMILPAPGYVFGPPRREGDRWVRTPAGRHLARQRLGPVSFAGQDVEGSPSIESALASGLRAANEVLEQLGA